MEDLFRNLAGLKINLPFNGKIDGLKAQLVWQFLRFNQNYRDGYDHLKRIGVDDDNVAFSFAQTWCLSTPIDYNLEQLQTEHHKEIIQARPGAKKSGDAVLEGSISPYFDFKPVLTFPSLEFLLDHGAFLLPDFERIKVINPNASPRQVIKVLSQEPRHSEYTIRGVRKAQLVDYIVFHFYSVVKGMKPNDLTRTYHRIFGTKSPKTFQTNSINSKIMGFREVASCAPWCFFTPPHR